MKGKDCLQVDTQENIQKVAAEEKWGGGGGKTGQGETGT